MSRRPHAYGEPGEDALPAHILSLIHSGHTQLTERLGAVEQAMKRLAAQMDSAPTTQRAVNSLCADVERARSTADALARLMALPRAPLRLGEVEVSDLLIVILSRWKTRAPQHTFELALPGHEPTLLGDATLIEQAIEGLIAWSATHSGQGDIRVSLRPSSGAAESDEVAVSVRCPLHVEDATQATHLFERLDDAEHAGDLAIELALTRAVAERHGGRVWSEASAVEQTVTLLLALPVVPAALPSAQLNDSEGEDAERLEEAPGLALALARPRQVIAVAHADGRMARYLRANLEAVGYSAKTATTLDATLKLIELDEPDLILLDLALPDEKQREPMARAMARTTAPVIALGPGGDPAACVSALDAGAADFIAQPLSVEETLARVRRALTPLPGHEGGTRQRIYTCGDLMIDDAQRLVTVGGAPAALSRTEYRLLRTLAQNIGKTLSHEALLAQVWGPAYSHEIEFVWVYIRRLRLKIEPDPAHPRYIHTAPGIGYRLAHPSAQAAIAE